MQKKIIKVYKSKVKADYYLYVDHLEDTKRVPEPLLKGLGALSLVMTMPLLAGRKLAHADADRVLSEIADKGFYLQLPPPREEYVLKPGEKRGASD